MHAKHSDDTVVIMAKSAAIEGLEKCPCGLLATMPRKRIVQLIQYCQTNATTECNDTWQRHLVTIHCKDTLQRYMSRPPCDDTSQRPVTTIHRNDTSQRPVAAPPCNDTLQRHLATIHCNDTSRGTFQRYTASVCTSCVSHIFVLSWSNLRPSYSSRVLASV